MGDGDLKQVSKKKLPKSMVMQDGSDTFKMFQRMRDKEDSVPLKVILEECAREGLHLCSDPRFLGVFDSLRTLPGKRSGEMKLEYQTFEKVVQSHELIMRALNKNMVIPNFQEFSKVLELLYQVYFLDSEGLPARHSKDYCTMSTEDLWGLAMYSTDGQKFLIGDTGKMFTLQACIRPFLYALVVNAVGFDVVHSFCGMEPVPYNFMEAMLNDEGKPYNPLTIGGALVCCAIWQTIALNGMTRAEKFEKFICLMKGFTGNEVLHCDNVAVIDEKERAHMVQGVLHNLVHNRCLPKDCDLEATQEFYFQICCLQVHCELLAIMSTTLANDGFNFKIETAVIKTEVARHTLSIMRSCGVYNTDQDFNFDTGLPAKFSKSGAAILILPAFFGMGLYSPFMTEFCKSRRAIKLVNILANIYSFHPFDHKVPSGKLKPSEGCCAINCGLFNAAETGDIGTLARMLASGHHMGTRDYMRRTLLHVAAAAGHLLICKFIMTHCPNLLEMKDNVGQTALDDAKFFKQNEVEVFLDQWTALRR